MLVQIRKVAPWCTTAAEVDRNGSERSGSSKWELGPV